MFCDDFSRLEPERREQVAGAEEDPERDQEEELGPQSRGLRPGGGHGRRSKYNLHH